MSETKNYFDNPSRLREEGVQALREARLRRNYSQSEVDRKCFLGGREPTCAEYEANPEVMDKDLFSKLALILRVSITDCFHSLKDPSGKIPLGQALRAAYSI